MASIRFQIDGGERRIVLPAIKPDGVTVVHGYGDKESPVLFVERGRPLGKTDATFEIVADDETYPVLVVARNGLVRIIVDAT